MTGSDWLQVTAAVGLALSIWGAWLVAEAVPMAGTEEGYLAFSENFGDLPALKRRYRWGWRLLIAGFVLQLIATVGGIIV